MNWLVEPIIFDGNSLNTICLGLKICCSDACFFHCNVDCGFECPRPYCSTVIQPRI